MMITHKLEMDLLELGDLQRIDAVQGDRNTRQLELTLSAGGVPWEIPGDIRVNLRYSRAEGTGGRYSQWPEGTDCWSCSGNVLTVLLAPPVLTAAGLVSIQVELERGDDLMATFALQMRVERNVAAGVLETENYVDRPQWMREQLGQWLETVREEKTFALPRYEDTPFWQYNLPLEESQDRYCLDEEDKLVVKDHLGKFSPVVKCPKYLGWKLEPGSQIYLYIGDMVDGRFTLDEKYLFHVHTTKNGDRLPNFLQKDQNRLIEVEEGKYFRYRISQNEGVAIVGCDRFPRSESDALGFVPDSVLADGKHYKASMNYGIVLPSDCGYGVLARESEDYSWKDFSVSVITDAGVEKDGSGVSVGRTGKEGVTLLSVPRGCRPEDLKIYLGKKAKTVPVTGRGRRAREMAGKLIRDFSFESKKSILWNDSALALLEGKRFWGVPYSSRWINSHYVGYEVSVETALNALNDPYSIAYDGGKLSVVTNGDGSKTAEWFEPVSGASEIPRNDNNPGEYGGPGYGLVCSVFACLIYGNPYPQSNRGLTFDSNFVIEPAMSPECGTIALNSAMSHCVAVDELYEDGYSLLEATDPCVAKTVHTNDLAVSGALNGKTRRSYLDNYMYTVTNLDDSGYDHPLPEFPASLPEGVVRPWRGHKAVYGPWDKSAKGSGIGVTIHPTKEQTETGQLQVSVVYEPGTEKEQKVLSKTVAATEQYLDISGVVIRSGTYGVSCGDGNEELFRYYDHDAVTLGFDAEGRAVFSHDDVLYAYVRVIGYGGTWGEKTDSSGGPMVIGAGKCYPDLAADTARIYAVYAAIVADPEEDCWGRYSCVCERNITSEYVQKADELTESEYSALMKELEGSE